MEKLEYKFKYDKYPVLQVKFIFNERETPFIDALLDSGGDFIVIPMPIAKYLELDLKKAGDVDTAGGVAKLYKANINMTIGNNSNSIKYENLEIHVSGRNDIPVLLGRKPIFEDYEIIFRNKTSELILRPAWWNNQKLFLKIHINYKYKN